jgi:hypothetical protein
MPVKEEVDSRFSGQENAARGYSAALLAVLAVLGLMTSLECGGCSPALSSSFSFPVLACLGLMTSLECGGSSTAFFLFLFLLFLHVLF